MTPSLLKAVRVWTRIGLLGFGGPAGQIALMHKELVETRPWIDEQRFLSGLNVCMLLPGPEAQQLAVYIGWVLHGLPGAVLAGGLFVLPGALVVLALSVLYAQFQSLPALTALFFGLKAAVLALVVEALHRMARKALPRLPLRLLAGAAFVAMAFGDVPFPVVVLAAAAVGALSARKAPSGRSATPASALEPAAVATSHVGALAVAPPRRASDVASHVGRVILGLAVLWALPFGLLRVLFGADSVFFQEALFFSKVATVTFGGAYAVLGYVAHEAVATFHWLRPGEMVDGLGLAETTPGPLILVLEFVGYVGAHRLTGDRLAAGLAPVGPRSAALAGLMGAAITLWATFVPAFLWIMAAAPWIEALRRRHAWQGALEGISAAVVGVIANLALWFGIHVLFARTVEHRFGHLHVALPVPSTLDVRAAVLATVAVVLLFWRKWGTVRTLAACAAGGFLLAGL
jgi:chromate transporter